MDLSPSPVLLTSTSRRSEHEEVGRGLARQLQAADLQELYARHGAWAALSARAQFKPAKEFHVARRTLYSGSENLEIDKAVPISASARVKVGRGVMDGGEE